MTAALLHPCPVLRLLERGVQRSELIDSVRNGKRSRPSTAAADHGKDWRGVRSVRPGRSTEHPLSASGAPWTPPVGLRVAATGDRDDLDFDGIREELIPARDSSGQFVYTHDFGAPSNVNSARTSGGHTSTGRTTGR